MSALLIRKELHEMIDVVDDRLVAAVYVMLQSLIQEDGAVVGKTTNGEALTKVGFIARVREGYADGKGGNVKSSEALLAEIES